MRIGVYDPYLDDLGGGEKYMMSIASCLSDKNEVKVFWNKQEDVDILLQRFNINLSKISLVENVFSSTSSLVRRLFVTSTYKEIIVLSDGSIPLVASKKLFLHIQQPLNNSQTKSLWGRFKLSRVNKVFCNSIYTKEFVDKALNINATVIYPPVSIHAKQMKKENIVLHVGRFRVKNVSVGDYKKQHIMIDVFKDMVTKGLKNWKFVLAVGVMEKDEIEFEKIKQGVKGFPIEFAINKTNEQLWDVYSKAKIYWHASGYGEDLRKHPEYAEHFGISTVEAMGSGAVPVVINAGGQKEIVKEGENGLLWDSLDELQEKTLFLIKNIKEWEKLSESAKKRAQDFSYEKFSENVHNLLK